MSAPSVEATPDQVLVALGGVLSAVTFVIGCAIGWRLLGNRNERRARRIVREAHRLAAMDRHPAGKGLGR